MSTTLKVSIYKFTCLDAQSKVTWEVQRYDGWYNNLAYHSRGAVGKFLTKSDDITDNIKYVKYEYLKI